MRPSPAPCGRPGRTPSWSPHATTSRCSCAIGRWPWRRLLLLSAGVLLVGATGQFAAPVVKGGLLVAALVVLALMFRLDDAAANRLFPSRPVTFRHPVGASYWMIFLYSLCTGQVSVFVPLGVRVLHDVGALYAGYFQAGLAIAWTVAAMIVARFAGRQVDFTFMVGMPCAALGVAGLAWFAVPGPLWAIAVAACAIGFGGAGERGRRAAAAAEPAGVGCGRGAPAVAAAAARRRGSRRRGGASRGAASAASPRPARGKA